LNLTVNVLIGGEAGQGLVTIGQILTKSLVRSGYYVCVTQSYMSRIRGGHNTFAVRFSDQEVSAPQEEIDLLIALNAETLTLHKNEMSPKGIIVIDSKIQVEDGEFIRPPFKELAALKFENTAALGIAGSLLGIDEEMIAGILDEQFGRKHPETIEENRKALRKSYEWAQDKKSSLRKFAPIKGRPSRLMMDGNQAISLGAASAGINFCSFYPMTPSTSIINNMIAFSKTMGIVVEQAEDEIAAINMAIGASYAGAPSMVATSGGGFALMVEGISLAAMTETPIVVVLAQRPAPATGLPTRTEQGDLNLVLYAGHGEFPRAIFAPGTPEECFYLTRKAVELAQKYQSPMFVLTDQFLADSYRAIEPFDVDNLNSVNPVSNSEPNTMPYKRYVITETGISPRLLPGLTKNLVVADSDEHDEFGHITEDLAIRKSMVEKRMRKGKGIISEIIPPDYFGDDNPDLLFVSWGSTKGAVNEAVRNLANYGIRSASLHFSQIFPLNPSQFIARLENAKNVISVEGNFTGQFANLLRQQTGFLISKQIHKYDGLPFTSKFILQKYKEFFNENS